jgi:lipopolysaccharide/colanic/teichoic acid biosynthesis glycosyltransferase
MVIGASDLGCYYMQIIENLAGDRFNIVAVLDDDRRLCGRYVHGYLVAAGIRDIETVLQEYRVHGVAIDRIVLAVEPARLSPTSAVELFRVAKLQGIPVDLLPEQLGLAHACAATAEPMEAVPNTEEWFLDPIFWRWKRVFDIGVAGALLLALSPLAVAISLLVLIDCGLPVVFWQVRGGQYGRKITVHKFRTLRAPYRPSGEPILDEQRVSWLGRLLRVTHLDELPQLLNVIKGDMSLVGPRPLLPSDLPATLGLRQVVRPGMTGWAQVNGATLLTPREKIALDAWYVRHASWKLEFAIIAATFRTLFKLVQRNENRIAEALREQTAAHQGIEESHTNSSQLPVVLRRAMHMTKPIEAKDGVSKAPVVPNDAIFGDIQLGKRD